MDINNFDNFTIDEHKNNLIRLKIESYSSLVGKLVYYSRKVYGEHKVISWCADSGEYLLDLDGCRFWTNPFYIKIID